MLPENYSKNSEIKKMAQENYSTESLVQSQITLLRNAIAGLLKPNDEYALLDFPDQPNVGDSAIWVGECVLFNEFFGKKPRYVCTIYDFDAEQFLKAHPQGPIFLHGGGNFGDVWPAFQEFRERIMLLVPGRQIIQLPQTIHFHNQSSIDRCAQQIKQHGNFHLMVRDQKSYTLAKENFNCPVSFLPDMAFGMGALQRPTKGTKKPFILLRTDSEKASYTTESLRKLPDSVVEDWLDEPKLFRKLLKLRILLTFLGRGGFKKNPGRYMLYDCLAKGRLARGTSMLSSGEVVLTDRLHAHILCTLMNVPHVVLDNNYGKVFSYMDAWTGKYQNVKRAKNMEEAVDQVLRTLGKGQP